MNHVGFMAEQKASGKDAAYEFLENMDLCGKNGFSRDS